MNIYAIIEKKLFLHGINILVCKGGNRDFTSFFQRELWFFCKILQVLTFNINMVYFKKLNK